MSEQTHRERISVDNPATARVNQPKREEGVVRAGAQPVAHERPEEWGWHGETGRWGRIGGVTVGPLLSTAARAETLLPELRFETDQHVLAFHEQIHVHVDDSELKTEHSFSLAGQRFLTLHYVIERL